MTSGDSVGGACNCIGFKTDSKGMFIHLLFHEEIQCNFYNTSVSATLPKHKQIFMLDFPGVLCTCYFLEVSHDVLKIVMTTSPLCFIPQLKYIEFHVISHCFNIENHSYTRIHSVASVNKARQRSTIMGNPYKN